MKNQKHTTHSLKIGMIFGVAVFVTLTFLTQGLMEVSRDVGMLRWVSEMAVYAVSNKLLQKLVASVAIGGVAAFAAQMISYGKAVKSQRHGRTTHLQFQQEDSGSTRTA